MCAGGRGWLWGGCSDNVDFGERISKQYVDAQETGQDSRAAVNLHNNAAGRLVSYGHTSDFRVLQKGWETRTESNLMTKYLDSIVIIIAAIL